MGVDLRPAAEPLAIRGLHAMLQSECSGSILESRFNWDENYENAENPPEGRLMPLLPASSSHSPHTHTFSVPLDI